MLSRLRAGWAGNIARLWWKGRVNLMATYSGEKIGTRRATIIFGSVGGGNDQSMQCRLGLGHQSSNETFAKWSWLQQWWAVSPSWNSQLGQKTWMHDVLNEQCASIVHTNDLDFVSMRRQFLRSSKDTAPHLLRFSKELGAESAELVWYTLAGRKFTTYSLILCAFSCSDTPSQWALKYEASHISWLK